MNISSLPSEYGIGTFGNGGRQFVDFLHKMNMSFWQILPLCPVGAGNSPYSSGSAFAINPLYIDPGELCSAGLLTAEESESAIYHGEPYSADYDFARENIERILRIAMTRADKVQVEAFRKQQAVWVDDYAAYMAGKRANDNNPWWKWSEDAFGSDIQYYVFEQYIAYSQWKALKLYANEKSISVLGDMPIYVSHDSADLFSHKALFLLDDNDRLTKVAGVPPDYFAEDGQLWGNPLYDWDKMKEDGYRWWLDRIENSLSLYDAVRIDHFRGFYKYWAVPAGASTAKEGEWEQGPGMELFNSVEKRFNQPNIIAEDLGTSTAGLVKFLEQTGYPGMKVMQFGFSSEDSEHAPYQYHKNCVAYTGTHDNDTMLGWLWSIPMKEKTRLLQYCRYFGDEWGEGGENSEVIRSIITTLWATSAGITIVPMQDLCGFGTDTRMNIPGKPHGNWQFRITDESINKVDTVFYKELNHIYGRG